MKQRYRGRDAELVKEIHTYIDLAFAVLGDDWSVAKAAAGMRLSDKTVRNLLNHEGQYCPGSLTLAKLGDYCGMRLILTEHGPRLRVVRRKRA